ncbi:MAG: hypothetical protein K1060chlam4_00156 [Candidatus Anoxychlamydiales bacterium]|nr:hypothetical protein [Candidatus Anoxychlamydiales bacterium]
MASSGSSISSSSKEVPSLAGLSVKTFYESQRKAIAPFRENHLDLCTAFAQSILDRKSHLLIQNLPKGNYCIFTTGSDGRLEKLSDKESPIELVVYSSDSSDEETLLKLQEFIKGRNDFFPEIESKNKSSKLCETSGKIIPTRGLHSRFLAGDKKEYENYQKELISQIKNMSTKDYTTFKKNFVRSSMSSLFKSSKFELTEALDLKNGIIYFDGKTFKKKATKYSHLRSIQYKLDKVICDHIRGKLSEKESFEFVSKMPANINDLIDYLSTNKLLDKISVEEKETLKKAYNLSLMYLHIAQNIYVAMNKPIEIKIDESQLTEFQDNFTSTYKILQKIQ